MPDPARNQHVLIVEDEARLREGLRRAVPAMGYVPITAGSAEEAMALMERDPCEVILLDLRLPGMNGMAFFEIVRQRWPRTQVIVATGYGDLDSAKRAVHLEAVEFLTKPCTLSDLESAIGRACQRYLSNAAGANRKPALAAIDAAPVEPLADATGRSLDDLEREHILAALERHHGNRTAAAEELGISRRTLHYRLREYADQGTLPGGA